MVLIEQGLLGGGTTNHATGLMGVLKPNNLETRMAVLSRDLYKVLEGEGNGTMSGTRWFTGLNQCGSLWVAKKQDRMYQYKQMVANSVQHGITAKLLTPEMIPEYCGLVNTEDLLGGLWVPDDGTANPHEICLALGQEAIMAGVTVVEQCSVQGVTLTSDKRTLVETSKGAVECDYFVNSAGFWSRRVGGLSKPKVAVPIQPCEHYHLNTKTVPDLPPDTPVVRDPDGFVYFRENEGRFLAGGFEPKAKPAFMEEELPEERAELHADWDHFYPLLENLLHRVPTMKTASLEKLSNSAEAFSPDGQWIIGRAPEMENYFVAAGMRSNGIASAGGVGTVIAHWITEGRPPFDMYNLDIARCIGYHNNKRFLRDRVREVPGLNMAINYPHHEFDSGRALRTSPIFPNLKLAGAQFGQVMGYERPMFFKIKKPQSLELGLLGEEETSASQFERLKIPVAKTETFYRPPWFQAAAEEFQAARQSVSLCDYSSFAKVELWSSGTEVVDFLQWMCSNNVDIPVNNVVHTGMQNEWGGFENDCTVTRIAENRFMLMSPSIQQIRSISWLKRHLPKTVVLQDVTSLYTALCIMGPYSRALMQKLTPTKLDIKNFPFFTSQMCEVGLAPNILTMNLTHTGEYGFLLYIPNEFAIHVYDEIIKAGKEFQMKHCGYYAQRAVRIEKFFAYWGQDLDSYTTPAECGRVNRCKLDSEVDFMGRAAIEAQVKHGVKKLFTMLLLDPEHHDTDLDPWPWGGEPIYRNGQFCGTVTTSSYGFSLKQQVCLGFVQDFSKGIDNPGIVTPEFVTEGTYEVVIFGVRYPATAKIKPPVLPTKVSLEGLNISDEYEQKLLSSRNMLH